MVSGTAGTQTKKMGLFQMQPALAAGGKPVWMNRDGAFMYYWPAYSDWLIGPDVTKVAAWLTSTSNTDTGCPQDSSGWEEYVGANESWVKTSISVLAGMCLGVLSGRAAVSHPQGAPVPLLPRHCSWARTLVIPRARSAIPLPALHAAVWLPTCCTGCPTEAVVVSGTAGVQNTLMGVFQMQPDLTAGGRRVYTNGKAQFLYYWPAFSDWLIGNDITTSRYSAATTSNIKSNCPQDSSVWEEWDGVSWVKSSISVLAGTFARSLRRAMLWFPTPPPLSLAHTHAHTRTHTHAHTRTRTHTAGPRLSDLAPWCCLVADVFGRLRYRSRSGVGHVRGTARTDGRVQDAAGSDCGRQAGFHQRQRAAPLLLASSVELANRDRRHQRFGRGAFCHQRPVQLHRPVLSTGLEQLGRVRRR